MRLLVQLLGRRFHEVLDPFHLTPLHWGVLCLLWQEDGQRTQAIARELEQLGGTLTVGLDTMEKRGLVRRKQDEHDKRVSRVWLTRRGRELESRVVPEVSALIERIFSCLDAKEVSELSRMVDRLREHADDRS